MTNAPIEILILGCGKMGGAMVTRWLEMTTMAVNFTIVDRHPLDVRKIAPHADIYETVDGLPQSYRADCVILAIKPQHMGDVLPALAAQLKDSDALYISLAAGRTFAYYTDLLGEKSRLIRAMPNTPSMIGQGMTVLCANANVHPADKELATGLMEAVGAVEWIDDEEIMHIVGPLSGGGPAYVFLLAECMIEAAVKAGMESDMADRLVRQTMAGAGALLSQAEQPPGELRQNVASPGGTTEQALKVFMQDNNLAELTQRAIEAAMRRNRELSK